MSLLLLALFCAIVFLVENLKNRRRSRSMNGFIQSGNMVDSAHIDWPADARQPFHPKLVVVPSKKIRVLLVDDHEIIRRGIAGLLKVEPDLEVIGEASNGEAGVDLARNMRPDVVLMDICMPGMDGVQATRVIHNELPEIRVIGLSILEQPEDADAIREAGAVSYLTKGGSSSNTMISVIRACAA